MYSLQTTAASIERNIPTGKPDIVARAPAHIKNLTRIVKFYDAFVFKNGGAVSVVSDNGIALTGDDCGGNICKITIVKLAKFVQSAFFGIIKISRLLFSNI